MLSDRYTPYTSQARVETFLTQVAPEVAGDVLEVGAKDNSPVKKGQLLFRIDPEPYQVAIRSAEANLAVALQAADVSVADVAAARAQVRKQRVDLAASRQLGKIVTDLVGQRALAETQGIRARADMGKTEADVTKSEADLRRAEANLGTPGMGNSKVRQALAALDQARLDLRNTTVVAPADGTVTNLRLAKGQYVGPGQPLLSFLESGPRWISADMRENQLGNVRPGQKVLLALDILPGKLFHGQVQSVGWGVSQGDEAPTGQLSANPPDQGWLRDPQTFPVRVLLDPEDAKEAGIDIGRSGAQANVMIFTEDESDHESDRSTLAQGRRTPELSAIAMALGLGTRRKVFEPVDAARLHYILRFAVGTTAAFTICEYMGWQPSALAAVLSGILLAKLPVAPPLKVGVALILVMSISAWFFLALTMWLHEAPHILFGLIGVILFLAFYMLAQAKAQLPLTLMLICVALMPIITLTHPDQAPAMRRILIPGNDLGSDHGLGHARVLAENCEGCSCAAAASGGRSCRDRTCRNADRASGDAGLLAIRPDGRDAGVDPSRAVGLENGGRTERGYRLRKTGQQFPRRICRACCLSVAGHRADTRHLRDHRFHPVDVVRLSDLEGWGSRGSNAELAFNATMVIFGLFLLKGDTNAGAWFARMVQFFIGCSFAVGMMALLWPRLEKRRARKLSADPVPL